MGTWPYKTAYVKLRIRARPADMVPWRREPSPAKSYPSLVYRRLQGSSLALAESIGPARKAWQLADTGWYGAAPVLRRRIQPDRCKALVGVGVIAAGQRDLARARPMLAEIDSACRQKSPNILS